MQQRNPIPKAIFADWQTATKVATSLWVVQYERTTIDRFPFQPDKYFYKPVHSCVGRYAVFATYLCSIRCITLYGVLYIAVAALNFRFICFFQHTRCLSPWCMKFFWWTSFCCYLRINKLRLAKILKCALRISSNVPSQYMLWQFLIMCFFNSEYNSVTVDAMGQREHFLQ